MAGPSATLETRYTANIQQMERELRRLERINNQAASNVANAHRRAAQQSNAAWANSNMSRTLERQASAIGASMKAMAGTIAAAFAGREAIQAADTYKRFTNALKVAGLEGENLSQVQEALYQSAIKNGVALEPLAKLYGRASQSAGDLGASQAELLQFTNGVTSALRVAGTSTEEASGALMQLSQALSAGKVQAEEFNSINEGARPILEAVARGHEKAGGSVAKLRKIMLDGKLTSKDMFEAFLKGSASLEAQASKSSLTVGAAMQNLQSALIKYIGEADEAHGTTEKLTFAIKMIADNMDVLGKSVAILGLAYSATFVPALGMAARGLAVGTVATVRSTVATIADTVALISRTAAIHGVSRASATAAVASRALGAALSFFGGPIGIAITAVGAAIAYMGVTSAKAAFDTAQLEDRINANYDALKKAEDAASKKRIETGNLTSAERTAAIQTAALTGEVHKLKDAYYMAAAAAKAKALQEARGRAASARSDKLKAREAYQNVVREEVEKERARNIVGFVPGQAPISTPLTQEQITAAKTRAFRRDEGQTWARAVRVHYNEQTTVAGIATGQQIDEYGAAPVTPDAGKPKKGDKGAKPNDPTDASRAAIEQAERAYQASLTAAAKTFEERHARAVIDLQADRDASVADLDRRAKEGEITKAAAEAAKALVEKTYLQNSENEKLEYGIAVADRQNEITDQLTSLYADQLRMEADALDVLADGTTNQREKFKLERQSLAKKQQADDEQYRVQQDILKLERERQGYTAAEIDELRKNADANRAAQKRGEDTELQNDQAKNTPKNIGGQIREYAESFGSLNSQLSNIAQSGIENLTTGLADAVLGAGSLQEAFGNMATAMVRQLIELAARFAIFEAIGMAFGMKGLGKASISASVGRNALGTNNWRGGATTMNEVGSEMAILPKGTAIMPANVLSGFMSPGSGGSNTTHVTTINNTVNANDAVLTDWVRNEIANGTAIGMAGAQKRTIQSINKQNKNNFQSRR